jgi:hypothetical protein
MAFDNWHDYINPTKYWEAAWDWGMKKPTADQMGQNPYQADWTNLVGQLQQQPGPGQSLAGNAYKQASQQGMNNILAMSRGGSAGAARQGIQQYGQMQQGMSAGYANAALQEELARKQMLQQALAGAGQAWFQPQAANLQAKMGTQNNMQMLTGFLSQLGSAAASTQGR